MSAADAELDPNEVEQYVLGLLHVMYPHYVWSPQDVYTRYARGLDLIGTRFPDEAPSGSSPEKIEVQVKLHDPTCAPTDEEWDRFLAGCFTCRIDLAIFVTTGCMTSAQRRESSEAGIIVIAGAAEIARVADQYGYSRFEVAATTRRSSSQSTTRTRRPMPN